ncbi:MAG TPA: methyltransferase domain-containing protein [Pantanalinema sp.]
MSTFDLPFPAEGLDPAKMPGHWLLARLGKRVLRPGGIELTREMLRGLAIYTDDDVVEFAPGLGTTARLTLQLSPRSYTAIDRDEGAVAQVQSILKGPLQRCRIGLAHETGLPSSSATVVYGEAMLTMLTPQMKRQTVREAFRCLSSGGRYGLHEMTLVPDDLSDEQKDEIQRELSAVIRVGARPLTQQEWRELLESEGFIIERCATAPMHLLKTVRLIQDEGLGGALRIAWNTLKDPVALKRVLDMRKVFLKYEAQLGAMALVARKP